MKLIESTRAMFQIPELKRRISFTVLILFIYRLGSHVPTPGINGAALSAELQRMTVIEWKPDCPQADEYRALARKIDENEMFVVPMPLEIEELEQLLLDYGVLAGAAA